MGGRGYVGKEKRFRQREQHISEVVEEILAMKLYFQHLKFPYAFNFIRITYFATFSLVLRNSRISQHG